LLKNFFKVNTEHVSTNSQSDSQAAASYQTAPLIARSSPKSPAYIPADMVC